MELTLMTRAAAGGAAAATGLLLLAPHAAGEEPDVERADGPDRIATAAEAALVGWDDADVALLSTAWDFPDALSAVALSRAEDAPLLLTGEDELDDVVTETLDDLGVSEVLVLGGESAVSEDVVDDLDEQDREVERIDGTGRFETGAALAARAHPDGAEEVLLALGDHPDPEQAWADAVASGALTAADDELPLLLTRHDELPEATEEALDELGAEQVTLVGGDSAITPEVADALEDDDFAVERIAGEHRWATSVALAEEALDRRDDELGTPVLASGESYSDALSAGALASAVDGTLMLSAADELPGDVDDFLRAQEPTEDALLVGGPAALDSLVGEQTAAALRQEDRPEPEPEDEDDAEAEAEADADDSGEASGDGAVDLLYGTATWYGGPEWNGNPTACGGTFDDSQMTAAHRTLPCGTEVTVVNQADGSAVSVTINDRGPAAWTGHEIDLSRAAFEQLAPTSVGVLDVEIRVQP